jgi:hypothetical protein
VQRADVEDQLKAQLIAYENLLPRHLRRRLHSRQYRCGDAAGLGLGYLMQVARKPTFLISAGTAICGGSAIAAVGPIAGVNE